MDETNVLQEATVDEIADELGRRFPGVVLLVLEKLETDEVVQRWTRGGPVQALGMIQDALHGVLGSGDAGQRGDGKISGSAFS